MATRHRIVCMCMSIRGFIRNCKYPDDYVDVFSHEGQTLSPRQAHEFLMDELVAGRQLLPLDKGCKADCDRPGCTGFDYVEGGCPGYNKCEEAAGNAFVDAYWMAETIENARERGDL